MPDDPLSLTFAALADPTRRAILARLAKGEATVKELAGVVYPSYVRRPRELVCKGWTDPKHLAQW